jgi:peptidoglycan/LPS O-acetylase OafA/YrhL
MTILALLFCHQWFPKLIVHNGLLDLLFAIVILALATTPPHQSWTVRWLSSRTMVLLGEASYAVYILHVPVKGWFLGLQRLLPLRWENPLVSSCYFLFYVAITVVVALLVHKKIELPARYWIRTRFKKIKEPSTTLAICRPTAS